MLILPICFARESRRIILTITHARVVTSPRVTLGIGMAMFPLAAINSLPLGELLGLRCALASTRDDQGGPTPTKQQAKPHGRYILGSLLRQQKKVPCAIIIWMECVRLVTSASKTMTGQARCSDPSQAVSLSLSSSQNPPSFDALSSAKHNPVADNQCPEAVPTPSCLFRPTI